MGIETKLTRSLLLLVMFLTYGCGVHYQERLLDAQNTESWPRIVDPIDLARDLSRASNPEEFDAIVKTTSGFHHDGYAVFSVGRILFTGVYGNVTRTKAEAAYTSEGLDRAIVSLEQRGICKALNKIERADVSTGDYLIYWRSGNARFCYEDGGYWLESNELHTWFWSSYGESLNVTYDADNI